MTAPKSVDPAALSARAADLGEPGSVAGDGEDVRRRVDVGRGRRCMRRRLRRTQRRADQLPQRLPEPGVGHPGRHGRAGDPEAAHGLVLPGLACCSTAAGPSRPWSSVVATSYLLGVSTRRVEKLVEQLGVASLSKSQVSRDGRASRRAGRGVPQPAAGRRAVHVRVGRRADHQGPRRRPHRQRARADRGRRQRRRRNAKSSAWTSSSRRTAPAGWRSCAP